MKTCSLCKRVLPLDSFPADGRMRTQLDSWCRDCYREKRASWKRSSPGNTGAWKEEERGENADPIQWAGLHCRHISDYVTRIVTRFESKTGLEAPPQLLAIRQLADQSAAQLPERSKAKPGHICCRNCGREFFPRIRNGPTAGAYCSRYCANRFKDVKRVMDAALDDD